MPSHWAVPVSHSPFTVISHYIFVTLCLRKRHVHLSRWGRSNIAAKLNKGAFQKHSTVSSPWLLTLMSHTQWLQHPVLHQEINKHHTLSASGNQIVSYWLLQLLTETTAHEDQGTIATFLAQPWFPRSSKPSTQPHFWLKCKFPLIDTSSNIRQHTQSSSDTVCTVRMGIDACPKAKCLEWSVKFIWKVVELVNGEIYRI